ncbi:MAG: alanine racemase [Kiritimatiellae bacterium]|nr:alanine racemase [Kiritimatiellia bacterium]
MSNTWIELDLGRLRQNIEALKTALGRAVETIFVVKANAYGHGLTPVACTAWACGVRRFAVFHLEEALELREHLPKSEILVLGIVDPVQAPTAAKARLAIVVGGEQHALELSKAIRAATVSVGVRQRGTLRCHVKVDTGMGRTGIIWTEAPRLIPQIAGLPGLEIEGICSHFASSDGADLSFTDLQTRRFREVISACQKKGITFRLKHISNSGGVMAGNRYDFNAVRVGILLYGYPPRLKGLPLRVVASPFLQWKTRVVLIKHVPPRFPISYGSTYVTRRPTTIGLLEAGYADGYFRCLGNRAEVLIRGKRRPVVGRVTMNLTVVDLGPVPDAGVGDEAVLLGKQGTESIWANELAGLANTIPYEILTAIRTPDRRFTGS